MICKHSNIRSENTLVKNLCVILNDSCRFSLCIMIIVSPDESWGYLGFSMVTPPPPLQRFPFGHDNLKNILVRPFKFGMWVYMGNATNAVVL